MYLETKLVIQV